MNGYDGWPPLYMVHVGRVKPHIVVYSEQAKPGCHDTSCTLTQVNLNIFTERYIMAEM